MIHTIVFSKNRPAQLDLLLRSIKERGPIFVRDITVIYEWTLGPYKRGYELCKKEHPTILFEKEHDFSSQVRSFLNYGRKEQIMFLCDDDIFIRRLDLTDDRLPEDLLKQPDTLCVSLRLGQNTTYCYPLDKKQARPVVTVTNGTARYWNWLGAEGDFGYPGSLDGHVFDRTTLRVMLGDAEYTNPNELEDQLSQACSRLSHTYPLMASYETSVLTGVPVNRVNETHPNRHGVTYAYSAFDLNKRFLKGDRLDLGGIKLKKIVAAHNELKLDFA